MEVGHMRMNHILNRVISKDKLDFHFLPVGSADQWINML